MTHEKLYCKGEKYRYNVKRYNSEQSDRYKHPVTIIQEFITNQPGCFERLQILQIQNISII